MEKKVGVITYHSAYNFGSVLQAYATQKVVQELGYEVKIINYRMQSQFQYYSMLHFNYGIKTFLKDLLHLPQLNKYITRKKRFEQFISGMNLTKEFREPEEIYEVIEKIDIFISGSDQIWNKHSNELYCVDWKYMNPYLLSFTNKRKISYASSIVNMSDDELKYIVDKIKDFDKISFREASSCKRFKELFNIESQAVIDPTLLLDHKKWECEVGKIPNDLKQKKYILYYALEGIKKTRLIIPKLKEIAEKYSCKLVVITPLSGFSYGKGIINAIDAGPREFLGLIKNADLVLTNSYHGTLFSVNLGTDFYTLQETESKDLRIKSILSILGLKNRIISEIDEIPDEVEKINFSPVWEKLNFYRIESIEFLKRALGNE